MGKKIDQLDVYDDVNTDKSKRDLFEVSKNTGTYASPTYATDGSRKISVEQLKETLFIKEINSYKSVTTGSPTFDKQAYNGIGNSGTYTLPTSTGKYEVLAIIIEGSLSVTVTGLGGGYGDLVFTNQNETAYLIDTIYGWYPLAVNKEVNSSAFELLANKATSILGNETDTTKYTNTKAVADYITFFYTNGVIPAIEGHIVDLESHPNSLIYAPTTLSTRTALDLKANINSPSLTGTPLAPTATSVTNTTQIATTEFVTSAISDIPTPSTPTLDEVTDVGNTTTNSITVGDLVVNHPSGAGVAVEITKGGAGEALTVNKTSGSGNVASFNNGTTLVKDLEVSTATASTPTFFSSAKKLITATGALLGTWIQTLTAKSTPIGADTIIVNDSASSFEAKTTTLTELWTNYLRAFVFSATLSTNRIVKANASGVLVDSNTVDDGTTITSTLNRVFTGASGSNNSFGGNSNKFLFNGANTIGTGSFNQVAPEMQYDDSGVGGALRGMLYLDGRANSFGNAERYAQIYINSGGDIISDGKNSLQQGIYINHRAENNGAFNYKPAIEINAKHVVALIHQVSKGSKGVFHLETTNADNFTSKINTSTTSGYSPIHYTAYSLRDDAYSFYSMKDATVSSGLLNNNRNVIIASSPTMVNGFGIIDATVISNSSSNNSVSLHEEVIVQNVGAGTTTSGKRYRHVNTSNGVASAYIMGLYAGGVVIGNTTALPKESASLDLVATNKGFLPNRLTTAQRDAVSWVAGDAGMMIYNSTVNKHQGWNGTTWNDMY